MMTSCIPFLHAGIPARMAKKPWRAMESLSPAPGLCAVCESVRGFCLHHGDERTPLCARQSLFSEGTLQLGTSAWLPDLHAAPGDMQCSIYTDSFGFVSSCREESRLPDQSWPHREDDVVIFNASIGECGRFALARLCMQSAIRNSSRTNHGSHGSSPHLRNNSCTQYTDSGQACSWLSSSLGAHLFLFGRHLLHQVQPAADDRASDCGVLIRVSLTGSSKGQGPRSLGWQPGGVGRGGASFLARLGGIRINLSLFELLQFRKYGRTADLSTKDLRSDEKHSCTEEAGRVCTRSWHVLWPQTALPLLMVQLP